MSKVSRVRRSLLAIAMDPGALVVLDECGYMGELTFGGGEGMCGAGFWTRGLYVTTWLLVSTWSVSAQEDRVSASEQQLASSLLKGLLANNESLSDYDVVVDTVKFSDEPEAHVTRLESTSRIVCRNHVVNVFGHRFSVDRFGDSEATTEETGRTELTVFTGQDSVYTIGPSGKASFRVRSKPIHLSRLGCPRFISLGLRGFPDIRVQPEYASVDWEKLLAGTSFSSAKVERGNAILKSSELLRNGESRRTEWKFSLSDLVPLERSVEMTLTCGRTVVQERESITWQEVGGVMYPLIVRREMLRSKRLKSGEVVDYLEFIDSELEWRPISIESDLPGELSPASFPTLASVEQFLNGDVQQ